MTPQLLGLMLRERAARALGTGGSRFCLFIGAGADIEAGGLTFLELKREALREFAAKRHVDALDPAVLDRQFESFLAEGVSPEQRSDVIETLFHRYERLRPSEAHVLTVLLCKYGLIDAVVTTNFDTLLERAEAQTGGRVFDIFAPGIAQPDMRDGRPVFPPRPVLVKLHGDLSSRTITHLSRQEIESRPYDPPFEALLVEILRSHRLIFVGYSGYDDVVADAVRRAGGTGEAYWVNRSAPSRDAPVVEALGSRLVFVEALYSRFVAEAAQQALSDRDMDCAETSGIFLSSLVADRVRRANERFVKHQVARGANADHGPLIPRRDIEQLVERFRGSRDRQLMVLASPSGCGKSSLAARLWQQNRHCPFPPLLILRAQSMSEADLAARIIRELESGCGNALARLYDFASWLRSTERELLIVLDGANEFSPKVDEVARLIRSIIEILLRIRNQRSIKVLVTIRQEVWNDAFRLLDPTELARVLWTVDGREDRPNAVAMGHFTPEEAEEAFSEYARSYRRDFRWSDLAPSLKADLQDPFLMGLTLADQSPLGATGISRAVVERALVARLTRQMPAGRADALMAALDATAASMLRSEAVQITEAMLDAAGIAAEERTILIDAYVLQRRTEGGFAFVHDRFAEIFFARAIERQKTARLTDLEDLCKALREAERMPRLWGALVISFAGAPPERMHCYATLLNDAMRFVSVHLPGGADARRLHMFLKDVLLEMAAHSPAGYIDQFGDRLGNPDTPAFARPLLIQGAGLLPPELGSAIWTDALPRVPREEAVEIETILYDRVAKSFVGPWKLSLAPLDQAPLSAWFGEAADGGPLPLCRSILLATRLGPDNLSQREWDAFSAELSARLRRLARQAAIPESHEERMRWIAPLANLSPIDANRLLFNALPDWLSQYYMDPARSDVFASRLSRLEAGGSLTAEDFLAIAPSGEIGHPVRYLIANLLYGWSYRQNPHGTVAGLAEALDRLPPGVPVEHIDLLLSCLFVALAFNGEDSFPLLDEFTRKVVDRFPQSYLDNPGQRRAMQHGVFRDDFDQQFEDGFNPLAIYFYHAPSASRRNASYAGSSSPTDIVPLYGELLSRFESENAAKGVIRIVHALGQMASIWPDSAMDELLKLAGRQEPTIRRSLVRVLAECFRRFPGETGGMIARSGAAFSPEERYFIECSGDARICRRALEQLHWARMLAALEHAADGDLLQLVTGALIRSTSWSEAMLSMAEGVITALRRAPGLNHSDRG